VGQDCTGGTTLDSGYRQWSRPHRKIKSYKLSVQNLAIMKDEMHGFHYHEKAGSYYSQSLGNPNKNHQSTLKDW
jgi:hypothetical protein